MSNPTNQAFLSKFASGDAALVKEAAADVNTFVRMYQREEGFHDHILPVQMLADGEIDRVDYTDKPVKFVDIEPGSPAAVAVPFASAVSARYIKANRVATVIQRIIGPKFMKDIEELKTYQMDIRQILSDNSLKDVLLRIDSGFIGACRVAMGGSAGAVSPATGVVQWAQNRRRIYRDSVVELRKLMSRTPQRLFPKTALINNISVNDILKWGRDQAGGDIAEQWLLKGLAQFELFGMTWIVTIKNDIVRENSIMAFAEPKFMGRAYSTQDLTMSVEVKDWMVSFFSYKTIGAVIANSASVVQMDFNQSTTSAGVDDGSGGLGGW